MDTEKAKDGFSKILRCHSGGLRAERGRCDDARGQRSLVVGEVAVAGSCGGDGRVFRGTARTASNVLSALIARGLRSFRYR